MYLDVSICVYNIRAQSVGSYFHIFRAAVDFGSSQNKNTFVGFVDINKISPEVASQSVYFSRWARAALKRRRRIPKYK